MKDAASRSGTIPPFPFLSLFRWGGSTNKFWVKQSMFLSGKKSSTIFNMRTHQYIKLTENLTYAL